MLTPPATSVSLVPSLCSNDSIGGFDLKICTRWWLRRCLPDRRRVGTSSFSPCHPVLCCRGARRLLRPPPRYAPGETPIFYSPQDGLRRRADKHAVSAAGFTRLDRRQLGQRFYSPLRGCPDSLLSDTLGCSMLLQAGTHVRVHKILGVRKNSDESLPLPSRRQR